MPSGTRSGVRAAIVGPGYIGRVHAALLRRLGVEVGVLVGRDQARTEAAARQMEAGGATTDLDAVLSDPAVDAVHVCTPNWLHARQAMAVLRAGKHLVCEKPLTIHSVDSAALTKAAGPTQVAAVAYCYRYYPLVAELRQRIAAGALGPVHAISGAYLADELALPTDFNWGLVPEEGGPSVAMADIGVHWCDLAEHLLGRRITELLADVQTVVPVRFRGDQQVSVVQEDALNLLLRFEGGVRGLARISRVSHGYKNWIQVEIEGSGGTASWNQEEPNTLWIRRRGEGVLGIPRDSSLLGQEARRLSTLPPGHPEGYLDAFGNLLRAVYANVADIRAGRPLSGGYPTLADGHRGVVLVQAALESARAGRWVRT